MSGKGYSRRLDEAAALAIDAFRPVVRKSTRTPYVTHLFAVAAMVGEYGGDEEQMCAALLHDYLEDIDGLSATELAERFGERVARMVVQCSDTQTRPKPPWRERKQRHLAKVLGLPDDTRLVMCADKLHNCRTLARDVRAQGLSTFDAFQGGRDGTLWYFREMVAALGMGWSNPLLDELAVAVVDLEDAAGVIRGA
jgi:(p)ppGpp synthase/HD superfamily hydrolase